MGEADVNAEWYHYVLVYGAWITLFVVAVGGVFVYPFRKRRRRR